MDVLYVYFIIAKLAK